MAHLEPLEIYRSEWWLEYRVQVEVFVKLVKSKILEKIKRILRLFPTALLIRKEMHIPKTICAQIVYGNRA